METQQTKVRIVFENSIRGKSKCCHLVSQLTRLIKGLRGNKKEDNNRLPKTTLGNCDILKPIIKDEVT